MLLHNIDFGFLHKRPRGPASICFKCKNKSYVWERLQWVHNDDFGGRYRYWCIDCAFYKRVPKGERSP